MMQPPLGPCVRTYVDKFTDNPCDLNGYIGVEALLFIQSFPHSHHPLYNYNNRYTNTRLNNLDLLLFRPFTQTNPTNQTNLQNARLRCRPRFRRCCGCCPDPCGPRCYSHRYSRCPYQRY